MKILIINSNQILWTCENELWITEWTHFLTHHGDISSQSELRGLRQSLFYHPSINNVLIPRRLILIVKSSIHFHVQIPSNGWKNKLAYSKICFFDFIFCLQILRVRYKCIQAFFPVHAPIQWYFYNATMKGNEMLCQFIIFTQSAWRWIIWNYI